MVGWSTVLIRLPESRTLSVLRDSCCACGELVAGFELDSSVLESKLKPSQIVEERLIRARERKLAELVAVGEVLESRS
jgi:hypothetical protein